MVHLREDEVAKRKAVQGQVRVSMHLTDLAILVADTAMVHPPIAAARLDAGVVALDCGLMLGEGLGYFADTGDVLGGIRERSPGSDPYGWLRSESASAARRGDRYCAGKRVRARI